MTDTNTLERLTPTADFYAWQEDGLCRDADSELFFLDPDQRGHSKKAREDRARAICAPCPVKTACLQHALSVPERFGVWGGKSVEERQELLGTTWDQ